jgi:hypothetical protein
MFEDTACSVMSVMLTHGFTKKMITLYIKGASRLFVLVLQRLGVTVASVYRRLYRHCSEPPEHMAPVDRAARARETVHIYGGTRDGRRAFWTHSKLSNKNGLFALSMLVSG